MSKKEWIKNNAHTILTVVGCVSTIITTGLAIKAGMNVADICEEDEPKKKDIVKACVPAAVGCGVTISAIIGADIMHRRQTNDLLAMCALIGSSYSGYRQEAVRRYGAEVDHEITDCVAKSPEVCCMCPDIPDKKCHWIIDMLMDDLPKYELDAYERDIINAEKHLNRNYILRSEQSFGDFLDFLGFNVDNFGNENIFGWAINDSEIYYIDFIHTKIDENTFKLTPVWAPWYGYDRYDMWGNEY